MTRTIPKVVIDTNTWVSAALRYGSIPERAVSLALSECNVLFSEETWDELEKVLRREKFDRYRTQADRALFLQRIRETAEPVKVETRVSVCRDPGDDKFLALALDAKAAFILSGDKDLLVLHPFRGVAILDPGAFLDRLGSAAGVHAWPMPGGTLSPKE